MSLFSSKRLRFNPLLEFHGSVSADNLEEASSSSNEVAPHKASHCSSRLLEWDNGWDIGDEANEEIIHPQYKDPSAQFETSLDSIWTWPTCHRDCVPVIIDRPTRERQPTPPPVHSYRRKTPSPQFLHPAELAHNHGKLEIVQCNNHSLSSSRVDLSTWELCEAVTRAEMWTQRSMKGLREHAQSLLAATEAEERRLRERLASLQSQMMISVETERSEEPSESTTIGENPAAERRKGDPRPQEQQTLLSAEENSSLANSYTNVTPPKPETIADAPCRSTVNSPLPSSISSLHPRIASRSRISPCCKIVSAARKPNTDVLQMKPAKSTQNSKALDVDKMYIEFVRTFEQAQPRHKAFSAYQCSSPCGTPSPPTPTDFEGHSCPLARIRGSAPLCSCHAFHLSCACSYNTDDTHNINKKHPFSPYDCYHYNYHHHRGQCHGPSRPSCPPHTAPCQESINPHYNNSYFNGLSAATNQTDFRQPYNTKEPPPALPHAKAMHSAREYAKGRQQFTPSHCARADVGEAIPSSTSKKLFDHTHSFNNGFIKVNGGGCSWFQFSPQRRLKSASATKSTKPQLLEQREVSKSTHWRPAFRDYSHDTMVRFNVSCTNPPYACDREEDFNQHNGSTRNPQSLQEAFQLRMKAFMARSEARQRFIRLNALERRLQAEYSVLRSLNNSNTVYPDTEMALRARTPRLSLPDCLHCPQFSSTIGRTAYGGAGMKKLEKSKRKLMTPYEAHQLAQVRKKISLFINRARMKQYSEAIRRRLLKSVHDV